MPITKLRPSFTLDDDRLQALLSLIPEASADGRINWETLRELLSPHLEEEAPEPEYFGLAWPGKREARREAQQPCHATLMPVPTLGVNGDRARHTFIEGENLKVLKLLLKSYAGRVRMIYIDPPYNTGNDYIYRDDFAESREEFLQRTGQADAVGEALTSNPRADGRFHSNWLSMMYPRLRLARELLAEDGVIFVSIDDGEVHHLRMLMAEIFGDENLVTQVVWQKKYTRANDARFFSDNHDHILVFARSKDHFKLNLQPRSEEQASAYSNPDNHPKGPWKATPLHAKSGSDQGFEYTFKNGVTWSPPPGTYPRFSRESLATMDANDEIWFGRDGCSTPARKTFLSEAKPGVTPVTIWLHDEVGHNHEANNELKAAMGIGGIFDNPKPPRLIRRMLQLATNPHSGDIVLDFFAGSCTTAHAVLAQNREDQGNRTFICIQFPEEVDPPRVLPDGTVLRTVADIGAERIRRVLSTMQAGAQPHLAGLASQNLGFRYYRLADSHFKAWQDVQGDSITTIQATFDQFEIPLVDSWKPADLLVELMLIEGFPLDSTVTPQTDFTYNAVQLVQSDFCAHRLFICLDEELSDDTISHLALNREDVFVCLDSALTDQAKMRLSDTCNLHVI